MPTKIVAGNWKMNKTLEEALSLTSEITQITKDELNNDVNLIVIPPFPLLHPIQHLLKESKVALAAQNCHQEKSGAFTGEVSVALLKSLGAEYVVIGHSERREYFKEDNQLLAQKVKTALSEDLKVIFCCGESLETREKAEHLDFVANQIKESLFDLEEKDFAQIILAYEPIWAIGTGKTASSKEAQEMHAHLRKQIAEKYSQEITENTSILYGGSVKPANAQEIFAEADVDGGLIGGASLKARDFIDIAKSF